MAFRPQKHTQVVPLTIQFEGDESLTVYYRPYALSFGDAKELLATNLDSKSDVEKLDVMADYLLKYVERADWEDAQGQPLPFTREVLESLPVPIVQTVFSEVMEAVNGGGKKLDASSQPS